MAFPASRKGRRSLNKNLKSVASRRLHMLSHLDSLVLKCSPRPHACDMRIPNLGTNLRVEAADDCAQAKCDSYEADDDAVMNMTGGLLGMTWNINSACAQWPQASDRVQ